jgi:hypothetical protein
MTNYGKILKEKEQDNPNAICRATYLFSNVGDLLKCYGRILRFPKDKNLYLAEMQLAMGDIIMQCRLIEEENSYGHYIIKMNKIVAPEYVIARIATLAGLIVKHLVQGVKWRLATDGENFTTNQTVMRLLNKLGELCAWLDWDVDEIEHLGFIHTCERFEQFERDGWK